MDVEVGLSRSRAKVEELNHFDHAKVEDQKRRQEGFRKFFGLVPHQVVDANRSEDEIFDELVAIWKAISIDGKVGLLQGNPTFLIQITIPP